MGIIAQNAGGAAGAKISRFFTEAKPCDCCKSVAALLFCRSDSAFMCIACDTKVHHTSSNGKHERVWMCEVCEQAPAAVTCKADAAELCFACDRDTHSANPLASRHERVPVVTFYDTAEAMVMKSTALLAPHNTALFGGCQERKIEEECVDHHHDHSGYMPESWIASNKVPAVEIQDLKSVEFLFSESESFLDFDSYHQIPASQQPFSDSVVPVQTSVKPPVLSHLHHDQTQGNRFEIDFTRSNISSYSNGYTKPSLSHSVSSSSMDVGLVPDGSSLSDISYSFARNMNSSVDLSSNQGSQAVGMDREARVLRYKEKRKNRKFEKTIRYASRKAYAETRPRIKGRFAKRTDPESDIDRMFGSAMVNFAADGRYGVVPSF